MIFARPAASKGRELDGIRAEALAEVKAEMTRVRLLYVTDLPGQDGIYLDKRAEAERYLTTQPPPADLAAFPYLSAEVGVTAPTARALAQLWLAVAAQTGQQAGPAAEGIRARVKAGIAAATSAEDVAAALADFRAGVAQLEDAMA